MEQYCITIEQAKKLGGLGASVRFGNSYWVWATDSFTGAKTLEKASEYSGYPAYHVGELGEILGNWCSNIEYEQPNVWNVYFARFDKGVEEYPTEAQARGALLQYLLESGLLD